MESEGRRKYARVDDCDGDIQTTLGPALNEQTAADALDAVNEYVPGAEVVGGYLTGSSAYGLALNPHTTVNKTTDREGYEGSDIDLFVVVREDKNIDNKDFVSDSYDVIDNLDEVLDYDLPAEVNSTVIKESQFLGELKKARTQWETNSIIENVELPNPGGDRSHKYTEFIESLKERISFGDIRNSSVENELVEGEKQVYSYLQENDSKVKKYMDDQGSERKRRLDENIAKGHLERAKHRSPEIIGNLGEVRPKTSLKNIVEKELSLEQISELVEGSFTDFSIKDPETPDFENYTQLRDFDSDGRQSTLSNYGGGVSPDIGDDDEIEKLVNDIISENPEVGVERTDSGFQYSINGQELDIDYQPREILHDAVNAKLGRAMSEVQIEGNPMEKSIEELVESFEVGRSKDQSEIGSF